MRKHRSRARMGEIGDQCAGLIEYLCPNRHVELLAGAMAPVAILPLAVPATLSPNLRTSLDSVEVAPVRIGHEYDVSPIAAVAASGSTSRHEFFASKADRTGPTSTPLSRDAGAISEHVSRCARPLRLDDAYVPFGSALAEAHDTVSYREDRVISAEASSGTGTKTSATLTRDDHSRLNLLSCEHLDAQSLGLRVASVL